MTPEDNGELTFTEEDLKRFQVLIQAETTDPTRQAQLTAGVRELLGIAQREGFDIQLLMLLEIMAEMIAEYGEGRIDLDTMSHRSSRLVVIGADPEKVKQALKITVEIMDAIRSAG